jgi:hypothetical protein
LDSPVFERAQCHTQQGNTLGAKCTGLFIVETELGNRYFPLASAHVYPVSADTTSGMSPSIG